MNGVMYDVTAAKEHSREDQQAATDSIDLCVTVLRAEPPILPQNSLELRLSTFVQPRSGICVSECLHLGVFHICGKPLLLNTRFRGDPNGLVPSAKE